MAPSGSCTLTAWQNSVGLWTLPRRPTFVSRSKPLTNLEAESVTRLKSRHGNCFAREGASGELGDLALASSDVPSNVAKAAGAASPSDRTRSSGDRAPE
jgi:hypothetical protein